MKRIEKLYKIYNQAHSKNEFERKERATLLIHRLWKKSLDKMNKENE